MEPKNNTEPGKARQTFNAPKWANVICLVFLLEFIWLLIFRSSFYTGLVRRSADQQTYVDWGQLLPITSVVILPAITLVLFSFKRRLGWLLLFLTNVVLLVVHMGTVGLYVHYRRPMIVTISNLLICLLDIAFLILLWQPRMKALYKIERRRNDGIFLAALFFIIFLVVLTFYYFIAADTMTM